MLCFYCKQHPTLYTLSITTTVPVSSSILPTKSGVIVITTETDPVSSSIQPMNIAPSDGATTAPVVTVVMVLVVMVVGILVVFFRVKKRKKQLLVNKIKTLTTADKHIEMEVKQEQTTADQPPYAEMSTEAPPHVPNKSE